MAQNISLDSSANDLDESFQKLLLEKRQLTNKENNPPSSTTSTHQNMPPEKPIRKDLMHERFADLINQSGEASSYIFQNTFSNDEDYAAINRLMSDFRLNQDTDERTPLQLIADTRPSTIIEESTINSVKIEDNKNLYADLTSSSSHDSVSTVQHVIKKEYIAIKSESSQINDDTLEEIEYVQTDDRLNYVPKKSILKNPIKKNDDAMNDDDDDDDIIVIDSSPEASFVTTKNVQSAETTGYSYYTAKTDQTSASKPYETTFYSQNESFTKTVSNDENSSHQKCLNLNHQSETETETLCNISTSTSKTDPSESQTNENKNNYVLNHTSESTDEMPEFNDTLERIEYMMAKGQKILDRKAATNVGTSYINSPSIRASAEKKKLKTTTTPAKLATPTKSATPSKPLSAKQIDPFKKPIRSPMVANKCNDGPNSNSKIPKPTSALKFRHIASPIAAYIKNTPEVPLIKSVKSVKSLFEARNMNKISKQHDESTCSVESIPTKSTLPRKFYTTAPQRQVIYF